MSEKEQVTEQVAGQIMEERKKKPYIGLSMEGPIARWYAKTTRKDLREFERLARELAAKLPAGARVLEIAPGPGFLAVALAKLGAYEVSGLDISRSFVRMASDYAKSEGVAVRFLHGSASDIPFADGTFDLIVCRAAFKNFSEPLRALDQMHRVLKTGGRALILDLRRDAPWGEIESYIDGLKVGALNRWFMRLTFKHMLLKRAYTRAGIEELVAVSSFKCCEIVPMPVGMEVRLHREQPVRRAA